MIRLICLGLATLVSATALAAGLPGPMKITFRTTDCDGATGMAQVTADHISRVQPYTCSNGRQLKQVLTRNTGGIAEAFTVSNEEAPKIEGELMRIQRAREKAVEQTRPIVIETR